MLVPRAQIQPPPADEVSWSDADDAERTVVLCRLDESVKAHLLRLELERAGVPYWWRAVPLSVEGVPHVIEFRVPAKHLEDARDVLARVEAHGRSGPVEDIANG